MKKTTNTLALEWSREAETDVTAIIGYIRERQPAGGTQDPRYY